MKILLTKASDWKYKEIIEIDNIMELKNIYDKFILDFNFTEFMKDSDKEKYKDCMFEAEVYDDYVE